MKKGQTCLQIDISLPKDSSVSIKESGNQASTKVWRMRSEKIKTDIVPVIIGALGTIKKGLDQNLPLLPGCPSA